MFGETLKQSFAQSIFHQISRANGIRHIALFLIAFYFPSQSWAYPCRELLKSAGIVMNEWAGSMPEAAPGKMLQQWLVANASMQIEPSEEGIEKSFEKVEKFRSLKIGRAENQADDVQKRAAIYDFVEDVNERYGNIPWAPYSAVSGQPAQIVLQHSDSVKLHLRKIRESMSSGWTLHGGILTAGIGYVLPIVGVAGALYYGYDRYRHWYQAQADASVFAEMLDVAEGRSRLGLDQILAIQIQAPQGGEWVLLMMQAQDVRVPEPEPETGVARGRRWLGRALFGTAPKPSPAQLRPTLIGFWQQGGNHETSAATPIP